MNTETFWLVGHKISPIDFTDQFDMITGITPAQTDGPPPHYHKKCDEFFMVTDGKMQFVMDGKVTELGKGEYISIKRGAVHTFSNQSDQPVSWINIHSPGGFLNFMQESGIKDSEEEASSKSVEPTIIQAFAAKAADNDMFITMM